MAKIQFGRSYLQIEGQYVPVADFALAPNDGVYFTHHVLLWMEPTVQISTMGLKGGWKRLFAGMPLIMTQAQGPGHIAFSQDRSGELIALPIQPGAAIDVREHIFLAATSSVTYDWFSSNIWYTTRNGNETETHYPVGMFMDRFFAPQEPGLLLIHAAGNAFIRHLQQGETILVKPTSLLFKDPSVQMQLHFEYPRGGSISWGIFSTWYNRHIWLRLHGPGRVAVQSAYKHMEDNGRYISRYSPATYYQW